MNEIRLIFHAFTPRPYTGYGGCDREIMQFTVSYNKINIDIKYINNIYSDYVTSISIHGTKIRKWLSLRLL